MKTIKKKITSEVTGTPEFQASGPVTRTEPICISKLSTSFTSEDLNKVVEKVNEIIENYNGCK